MIIQGDSLTVLKKLEPQIFNCCVTSPPYYGLRDYGVYGQLGLEETPEQYIENMTEVFREVRRVLRDDGTLWLNIGDSRVGTGGDRKNPVGNGIFDQQQEHNPRDGRYERKKNMKESGLKPKDLIGIPWMLAFALRTDGWYLRQDIIWHKSNPMPESVRDRCTQAHEYIFLLSKSSKYYYDYEAIKEPCVGYNNEPPAGSKGTLKPNSRRRKGNNKTFRGGGVYTNNRSFDNSGEKRKESIGNNPNKTGLRNKRSVWKVGTRGYRGAHFATFPSELITPCILAGCPKGGNVIDPFSGSGTTGEVAIKYGREYVGIEINSEYCQMQRERLSNVQTKII